MRASLLCVLALALMSTVSCRDRAGQSKAAIDQQVALKRIQADTGIVLPAGSKVSHFEEPERVVDPIWVCKILIPSTSHDAIEGVLKSKPADTTRFTPGLANSVDWWRPKKVTLTKQFSPSASILVYAVLTKEENESAMYVECVSY